jgi:organic radical activating enzyme
MENLKTEIYWSLHDYCKSECEYCPIQLRGGPLHRETSEYIRIITNLIDSYKSVNRTINWHLDGGEPLDMDGIVTILKLCKTNGNFVELNTNGGRLWMDWWAIEPYVDSIRLTFHYWQNPALIKYIIDTFASKGKRMWVASPIRPSHFDEDLERVFQLEKSLGTSFTTEKTILYKDANMSAGMFPYTAEQLATIDKLNAPPAPIVVPTLVEKQEYFKNTTWDDRYRDTYNSNTSYTGQLCNAGVEQLYISHTGWATGSHCGNQSLGNIWDDGWHPNTLPQKCTMISCIHTTDQKITKFPLIVE